MQAGRHGLTKPAFIALQGVVAFIFFTHGFARIYYGSVGGFGDFLDESGLPLGIALAWLITLADVATPVLLCWPKTRRSILLFQAGVLLCGIVLVHAQNGWFVVGHGAGGVEYSVLLLAVLGLLFVTTPAGR